MNQIETTRQFDGRNIRAVWMQTQIVGLLQQMADGMQQKETNTTLSNRLRGIAAHAPKDFQQSVLPVRDSRDFL